MESVMWKQLAVLFSFLFATVGMLSPSVSAQTTHALLIVMDGDVNIGPSAQIDGAGMEQVLSRLRVWNICQVNLTSLKSSRDKIRSADIFNWIKELKPSDDDTIMIYYSGHGFVDEMNRHYLSLDEGDAVPRSDIIASMQALKCKLKMLITDSCSNLVSLPTPVTATSRSIGESRDKQYYRNLFVEHEGLLDITAASEGEYAWGNSSIGGYFTSSLISAFSGDGSRFRSWEEVFLDAQKGTQELFKQTTFSAGDIRRMSAKGISNQTPKSYSLPRPLASSLYPSPSPVSQAPGPLTPPDKDTMVLIPAGEFEMGADRAEITELLQWARGYDFSAQASWFEDETPRHTVYLDAFYIDAYEVTNAQYKKFLEATGHKPPDYWDDPRYNHPDQPVVGVSWEDAKAYCDWAGKRLPTEAEWEKAARGGLIGKRYPWGDEPSHEHANYIGTVGKDIWSGPAPVGSFAPNGYGLYDVAGNVYEWCADWYDKNYYAKSPRQNPKGPDFGVTRVVRGGGWNCAANALRVSDRFGSYFPTNGYPLVGFRCAK